MYNNKTKTSPNYLDHKDQFTLWRCSFLDNFEDIIVIENIIVIGKSYVDHVVNIRKFLHRVSSNKFKLEPKKCELFTYDNVFLGHQITWEDVKMSPAISRRLSRGQFLERTLVILGVCQLPQGPHKGVCTEGRYVLWVDQAKVEIWVAWGASVIQYALKCFWTGKGGIGLWWGFVQYGDWASSKSSALERRWFVKKSWFGIVTVIMLVKMSLVCLVESVLFVSEHTVSGPDLRQRWIIWCHWLFGRMLWLKRGLRCSYVVWRRRS